MCNKFGWLGSKQSSELRIYQGVATKILIIARSFDWSLITSGVTIKLADGLVSREKFLSLLHTCKRRGPKKSDEAGKKNRLLSPHCERQPPRPARRIFRRRATKNRDGRYCLLFRGSLVVTQTCLVFRVESSVLDEKK